MRAKLWYRTRRDGALLCAPFRVTGRGASSALSIISIGADTRIGALAWFSLVEQTARVSIGARCTIGTQLGISVRQSITIGDGTGIGDRSMIMDHAHDQGAYIQRAVESGERPEFSWEVTEPQPVVIGNGVHIGVNVVISPGVHIGDGAIVGAGSVVTRSVEPYTVVAGVPARPMRSSIPEDGT